jgi:hypothetical protein
MNSDVLHMTAGRMAGQSPPKITLQTLENK